jgi:hypothetical protein
MMVLRHLLCISAIVTVCVLASCGGGSSTVSGPAAGTVVLARGTYTSGSQSWQYALLQLPNADGGYSYAQWFPPRRAARTPVIVRTEPYAGIDWTGAAVDQRWALQGNGCFPDVDGPNYQPGVSGSICYEKFTPDRVGAESEIYLRNGFGVLTAFGRFYAGGSVWNDVQDMVAGLRFLGTQSNVDTARIGMLGSSWGGFEVVYGAAYATTGVVPKVGVAISPVIDFQQLVDFIDNTLPTVTNSTTYPQYTAFFDPYLRRLFATTGGRPGSVGADYSRVTAAALGSLLNTQLLIMHDDGDTILPVATSKAFVAANPAHTQGFWYTQSDTIDYNTNILTHGRLGSATVYAPIYSFSIAYLFTALGDSGQALVVPYGNADLDGFFQDIRTYQTGGRDVSWVVPRLRDLCDARVSMYDLTPGSTMPVMSGAQLLAAKINAKWGTAFNSATVCSQLAGNGLPP